jgi:hypothetical protein
VGTATIKWGTVSKIQLHTLDLLLLLRTIFIFILFGSIGQQPNQSSGNLPDIQPTSRWYRFIVCLLYLKKWNPRILLGSRGIPKVHDRNGILQMITTRILTISHFFAIYISMGSFRHLASFHLFILRSTNKWLLLRRNAAYLCKITFTGDALHKTNQFIRFRLGFPPPRIPNHIYFYQPFCMEARRLGPSGGGSAIQVYYTETRWDMQNDQQSVVERAGRSSSSVRVNNNNTFVRKTVFNDSEDDAVLAAVDPGFCSHHHLGTRHQFRLKERKWWIHSYFFMFQLQPVAIKQLYMRANKLAANPEKTKFMMIGIKKRQRRSE